MLFPPRKNSAILKGNSIVLYKFKYKFFNLWSSLGNVFEAFQAQTNCVLSHRILTPELKGFKAKVRKKMSLGLDNYFTILNEGILSWFYVLTWLLQWFFILSTFCFGVGFGIGWILFINRQHLQETSWQAATESWYADCREKLVHIFSGLKSLE